MKTTNRIPYTVPSPSSSNVKKYFENLYQFKGVIDDKNFLAVDQTSFADSNNVYVDQEGLLRSRPSLKRIATSDTNIVDTWVFDTLQVYKLISGPTFDSNDNPTYTYQLKFVNGSNVRLVNCDEQIKLVLADRKIFVFSSSKICYYDIETNLYYTSTSITDTNVKDHIYIPVTKTITNNVIGSEDETGSENILTTSYYTQYVYTHINGNIDFEPFVGQQVKFTLDGVEYNITWQRYNEKVLIARDYSLTEYNFKDGQLLCDVGSNGLYILSEYIENSYKIYLHSGLYTELLPQTNGILRAPMISRDGLYCIIEKSDGLYIISLTDDLSNGRRFATWTLLNTGIDTTYNKIDTYNFQTYDNYAILCHHLVVSNIFIQRVNGNTVTRIPLDYRTVRIKTNTASSHTFIVENTLDASIPKTFNETFDKTFVDENGNNYILNFTLTGKFISSLTNGYYNYSLFDLSLQIIIDGVSLYSESIQDTPAITPSSTPTVTEDMSSITFLRGEVTFSTPTVGQLISTATVTLTTKTVYNNANITYDEGDYRHLQIGVGKLKVNNDDIVFLSLTRPSPLKQALYSLPSGVLYKKFVTPTFATDMNSNDVSIVGNSYFYAINLLNVYKIEFTGTGVTDPVSLLQLTTNSVLRLSYDTNHLLTKDGIYIYDNGQYGQIIPLLSSSFTPVAWYDDGVNSQLFAYDANYLYSSTALQYSDTAQFVVNVLTPGQIQPFVFEHKTQLSDYFFSNGNKLYVSDNRGTGIDDTYKWYIPKISIKEFNEPITNLHPISATEIAIFFNDSIYYRTYDENIQGYRYYKSKIDVGCIKGNDVITSYDGKFVMFVSKRGFVAMSYQEFLSTSEQALSYLSDDIYGLFTSYIVGGGVKLFKYAWYIVLYKRDKDNAFIFDIRNNSWWPISAPHALTKFVEYDNHVQVLSNNVMLSLNVYDPYYYDQYSYSTNYNIIPWHLTSQKLYLKAANYYKHIVNMTFMSTHDLSELVDSEHNVDDAHFELQVTCYRNKVYNYVGDEEETVVDYKVTPARTFVQRLNYAKVNEFQYKLYYNETSALPLPLSLSNLTIKYKIGSQTR